MTQLPPTFGIIPARYGSTRFPGKPLADILGKPMFYHVWERASRCALLKSVVVATDDDRVMWAADELGVPCVMTRFDHESGTDRVMEAARSLRVSPNALVVNIQGDEPLLEPMVLTRLIERFESPEVMVATPVVEIAEEEARNPDLVKVVFSTNGRALYFSRALIPFPREGEAESVYGHIGIYAFRMKTLETFVSLPPGRLERTEKLEQLRLLENGIPIHVVKTDFRSRGVDRPEDIRKVARILAESAE
jgi:3-deoxy-manno-octulosonate cytidylyltransferase (CMP-KDO synthetase)